MNVFGMAFSIFHGVFRIYIVSRSPVITFFLLLKTWKACFYALENGLFLGCEEVELVKPHVGVPVVVHVQVVPEIEKVLGVRA